MIGLAILDLVIVGLYFLLVLAIGVWASRRIHTPEDYLLGGRRFGKLIQVFASFGQATSSDGPVGTSTTTFSNGAGGIWSSLLMLFSTPLFWITSPWLRRLRVLTMGDFYEERYGSKRMAGAYAIVATIGMMGLLALGFSAMTKTILAMTPKPSSEYTSEEAAEVLLAQELAELQKTDWNELSEQDTKRLEKLVQMSPRRQISYLREEYLVWTVTIVVLLYAITGGLEAAFYTDMLQGVFIILLSIALIPFAWGKINSIYGGTTAMDALTTIHHKLPEHYFDIFGSPKVIDFTWYYILTASLIAGITVVAQPNQLVTNAAAKDEYSARFGFVIGVFIKRICTILWGVFGLAAILLYQDEVQNTDLVWGHATRDLLGPGLTGLMIASMMAALMSTADALILGCSGLLMHNFYRPLFPGQDDKQYVWAGRAMGALVLFGGGVLATRFENILQIIKFIIEFFVIFAPAFWLGMKWRRANCTAAWTSILVTLLLFYLIPLCTPLLLPQLRTSESLAKRTHPAPIESFYSAVEADVVERSQEIDAWKALPPDQQQHTPRPETLRVGDSFVKTTPIPRRGIFWSQGVKADRNGRLTGSGYLYLELLALDKLGWDLESQPHALNETIRVGIRLLVPFLVLVVVACITRPDDQQLLNRFFAKMRTHVVADREQDAANVAETIRDPNKANRELLLPNSDWEIYKWNKTDTVGFVLSIVFVLVVIGLLFFAVALGS